jgi:hypothetical protein
VKIRQANRGNERHHVIRGSTDIFLDVECTITSPGYIPQLRTEREPFPLFASRQPRAKGVDQLLDRIEPNRHVDGGLQR